MILIYITRIIAFFCLINTLFCLIFRFTKIIIKKVTGVIYSSIFCVTLELSSIMLGITFVMGDLVKNSVIGCDTEHIIFFFISIGVFNLGINIVLFIFSGYSFDTQDNQFILTRFFLKKNIISFDQVDRIKSRYIYQSTKLKYTPFIKEKIYFLLVTNDDKNYKIDLNYFMKKNTDGKVFDVIAFELKIKREAIN